MNVNSDQTILAQIKSAHREAANLAAETGRVPAEFENDPSFLDLISALRHEQDGLRR